LDENKVRHLKDIGVDRIQLSIDSLNADEHDAFRNAKGSHARALAAVEACQKIGLGIYIQTVVTKERLYSQEFKDFIKYFNDKNLGVFVSYAKPVGAWEGHFDNLINRKDFEYMHELEKKYNVYTHLTPGYGINMGCIAVKGMISVTQYGDVLPCPYIHISIGNVFKEPLKDIIKRGLNIKYFGGYVDTCSIAEDIDFLHKYIEKKVYNKPLPVPCSEVFSDEDKTKIMFNENKKLFF
jgi:MoaA/NifB/PqqE/SkfB family radical SAM enzyme